MSWPSTAAHRDGCDALKCTRRKAGKGANFCQGPVRWQTRGAALRLPRTNGWGPSAMTEGPPIAAPPKEVSTAGLTSRRR